MSSGDRYGRQIALFGREGQERLERVGVMIVGLGGLGSHIAQQLSFLGVQRYVLIDHDTVTTSNLNRLIGATDADADLMTPKVEVSRRLIEAVQRDSQVTIISEELNKGLVSAQRAVQASDVVFGCVDDDLVRLHLTELASIHGKPLLDSATDVGANGTSLWYGGRVVFAADGKRCLSCLGLLDQQLMARSSMTSEQKAIDDSIYGVPTDALEGTGPSVVSINGRHRLHRSHRVRGLGDWSQAPLASLYLSRRPRNCDKEHGRAR